MIRPDPVPRRASCPVDRTTPPRQAAERLLAGERLVLTDLYGTGVAIQDALEDRVRPATASFEDRRAQRLRLAEVSSRLLAPIRSHRVDLKNAGPSGFLPELYPDTPDFYLPFVEVQRLHGAWKRYEAGLHLAVLGHRVHPYYGVYAPTRTAHLELFGTWLSQYDGPRAFAIDVGTGCGVLALMLCRARFSRVLATDLNPNAIESVRRELPRRTPPPPITLFEGDLLGPDDAPAELIVFNPPWIPGVADDLLGEALFHDENLLERFFHQASERLQPDGRVVLVYSNIGELVRPDLPHPIQSELERGRFTLVQKLRRRVQPPPGPSGKRRRTRERVEVWELASR